MVVRVDPKVIYPTAMAIAAEHYGKRVEKIAQRKMQGQRGVTLYTVGGGRGTITQFATKIIKERSLIMIVADAVESKHANEFKSTLGRSYRCFSCICFKIASTFFCADGNDRDNKEE